MFGWFKIGSTNDGKYDVEIEEEEPHRIRYNEPEKNKREDEEE